MMRPKNFMAMSEKKCVKLKGGGNEEGRRCLVDADELGRGNQVHPEWHLYHKKSNRHALREWLWTRRQDPVAEEHPTGTSLEEMNEHR